MIDRVKVVYEFLTATSDLSAIIGDRVYSPVAPRSWTGDTKAIIYHQEGADAHITAATNTGTFVFKCYGGTKNPADSNEVFRELFDRLQMASESTTSGRIVQARLLTDSKLEPEPDTKLQAHMARFQIMFEGS